MVPKTWMQHAHDLSLGCPHGGAKETLMQPKALQEFFGRMPGVALA
jgi:hypothetical protein